MLYTVLFVQNYDLYFVLIMLFTKKIFLLPSVLNPIKVKKYIQLIFL